VPGRTITLKQEVAEFLASNNVGSRAFVLGDIRYYSATKAPITEIKLVGLVCGRPAKPVSPWL